MKVYPETKKYKKHDLCVISIENQFLVSFSLDPALYYATPRHNPQSDILKNGLKSSTRLEGKKSWSFSAKKKKKTTGWDITKNVEGGGFCPPPDILGLKTLDSMKTQHSLKEGSIDMEMLKQHCYLYIICIRDIVDPCQQTSRAG